MAWNPGVVFQAISLLSLAGGPVTGLYGGPGMAQYPVIDGIHRVAFKWKVTATGHLAVNVMHFKGASSDPAGLFAALNTNVTNTMWANIGTDGVITEVQITPLDSAQSATQVFAPTGAKWAGLATPGDYSPHTATVISLRTAKRGRQNRGRIYLPFPIEANMIKGTSASVATAQTAWDTFRTAMTTGSWPLHVASYGHGMHRAKTPGGGYVITPVSWTPHSEAVTSLLVEPLFGTQRRRQSRLRQ